MPDSSEDYDSISWLNKLEDRDYDSFKFLKRQEAECGVFMSDIDCDLFNTIADQCGALVWILNTLGKVEQSVELLTLPLFNNLKSDPPFSSSVISHIPKKILHATGFRECLEETISFGDEVTSKFYSFRPEILSSFKSEHYYEGKEAALEGMTHKDCPYLVGSDESNDWNDGLVNQQ